MTSVSYFEGQTYINPVIDENHPDPGVLKLPDGTGFVAVTTSNYANSNDESLFPILFSDDLVNWEKVRKIWRYITLARKEKLFFPG